MTEEQDHKSIKEILCKGSNHKAPFDMRDRVLVAWKSQESAISPYKPIIPRWFWWIPGIVLVGIYAYGFLSNSGGQMNSKWSNYLDPLMENLSTSIANLQLIVLPCIAVILLLILINATVMTSRFRKLSF